MKLLRKIIEFLTAKSELDQEPMKFYEFEDDLIDFHNPGIFRLYGTEKLK